MFLPYLCAHIAGWSSWQLVGLITQRSQVRVLSPLLQANNSIRVVRFFIGTWQPAHPCQKPPSLPIDTDHPFTLSVALTTALLHLTRKAFSRQTYMYERHSYLICWQHKVINIKRSPHYRGSFCVYIAPLFMTFRDESCKTKTAHEALPLIDCLFQSCTSPQAVAIY